MAQQKENLDKTSAEYERVTVAFELAKRSVDDPNIYKDVYAIEKRVENAREQVKRRFAFLSFSLCFSFSARTNEK